MENFIQKCLDTSNYRTKKKKPNFIYNTNLMLVSLSPVCISNSWHYFAHKVIISNLWSPQRCLFQSFARASARICLGTPLTEGRVLTGQRWAFVTWASLTVSQNKTAARLSVKLKGNTDEAGMEWGREGRREGGRGTRKERWVGGRRASSIACQVHIRDAECRRPRREQNGCW